MFSEINIIIFILWVFSAISDYSYFVYFVQLKEYRWDRFRDFLGTEQGKHFTFQFNIVHRAILIMIILFLPLTLWFEKIAVLGLLIINFFHDISKIYKRKKFVRPIITFKALSLIAVPILLEVSFLIKSRNWDTLLALMMTRIFVLGLVTYGINLITNTIKSVLINRAKSKIGILKNLIVIGITGSYGKTATKIFLNHILSKKFKVVCTPKHINTEIGVAKFILQTNFSDKEIFIVEMGAYQIGEIKTICDMVHPKIGILTAISEQHLSLFGDIKKTQQAKYELLRALPKNGLAITNVDNPYCREFLSELKCRVATFGIEKEFNPSILITNINDSLNSSSCTVEFKGETVLVDTGLRGAHNIFNVLPCVLAADFLGMTKEEIKSATTDLPQTITIYKYGSCDIVDDSYNSNPDGFKAALAYINKFPSERRRVVITRGMLELGDESDEAHQKMAGEIAYATDGLVLITPDFEKSFRSGVNSIKYKLDIITKYQPLELLEYIKNLKNTNAVVLLENRLPSAVMQEIKDNSKKIDGYENI